MSIPFNVVAVSCCAMYGGHTAVAPAPANTGEPSPSSSVDAQSPNSSSNGEMLFFVFCCCLLLSTYSLSTNRSRYNDYNANGMVTGTTTIEMSRMKKQSDSLICADW